ncbi:MAG: thioredoxin domain-containing protein [Spirochaetota bacterium]
MKNKSNIFSWIIITASLAGLALSVLLIFEYFGVSPAAADAVCSRGRGGINACTIVSASRFAALRGVPLIGDLPVAVFGFVFYGFIAALVILQFFRKNSNDTLQMHAVILVLSVAALLSDIFLYFISIFIIKFVCPLCIMTYAATAVILLFSIILVKSSKDSAEGSFIEKMKDYLRKEILLFAVIAVALAAAGISIGVSARMIAQTKESSTYEERLKGAIRRYETAKAATIDLKNSIYTGKQDAPVSFVVFFDFTCSHCSEEMLILEDLLKKYENAIAISFKNFPLNGDCTELENSKADSDAESCIAAAAGLCADRQGKFMEYAKLLFKNYHNEKIGFTKKSVRNAAQTAGLNILGFDTCFLSKEIKDQLLLEIKEAEKIGVESTPAIFLNGRLLAGKSRKADMLEGLVQYCLKRNK